MVPMDRDRRRRRTTAPTGRRALGLNRLPPSKPEHVRSGAGYEPLTAGKTPSKRATSGSELTSDFGGGVGIFGKLRGIVCDPLPAADVLELGRKGQEWLDDSDDDVIPVSERSGLRRAQRRLTLGVCVGKGHYNRSVPIHRLLNPPVRPSRGRNAARSSAGFTVPT